MKREDVKQFLAHIETFAVNFRLSQPEAFAISLARSWLAQDEELTRLGGMYQEQLDLARHRAVANAEFKEEIKALREKMRTSRVGRAVEALSKLRGGGE